MIDKFIEKHDEKVHRFLEIVPGFLTWLFILSPIWVSLLYPPAIIYILTFLTVYWSYLAITGTAGGFIGYKKYKKELAVNWQSDLYKLNFAELPEPETKPEKLTAIKHFILIPAVNEPKEVLKPTIDAIFNQTFPTKQITLVFALEERGVDLTKNTILEIVGERANDLDELLIYVHPGGIEGEAIGVAGANRTWGAKHAVDHLRKTGKDIKNYIFTTMDCDHVIHSQFLARLTHLYLTSDKRNNRFFSPAVYTFNNNNWNVPAMMRIEANFVTIGTLSDWAFTKEAKTKDSFSNYSASLQTLIDADYWDPSLGIDDTIFYWRAFFARNGDFIGTPHYIPFSADAVQGKNYFDSYKSLYKQLLRWGYGVIDFPLSIKGFLTNKKVPLSKKIAWTLKHLRKRVILINIAFLITFGFGIATLVNPNIKQTNFAYSLPNSMSAILTFTMIFLIPGLILRSRITNPIPKHWPFWRRALTLLEGPLVIINLLTFSFIPYVDAQTRMMFGKKMKKLYHTRKFRENQAEI